MTPISSRRFVAGIHDVIGDSVDIPAPDVNTNPQVMARFMDEYAKFHGFRPGVGLGGKPGKAPHVRRSPG